jgi:membrane protease YdiL (CAAX protease family)
MDAAQPARRRRFIWLGLFLAMFGTPLFLWGLHWNVGEAGTLAAYLGRELGVFLLLGLLLWLIRSGEGLPFASIGWHTRQWRRSALWGGLGMVLVYAAMVPCVGLAYVMHWKLGLQSPARFTPPLWAMAITVLRAGITEEVFYRGYAMERLESLTGSRQAALWLTILPFSLFHFRQGPAGILLAFAAALVLSVLYLKRRDLKANMLAHVLVDLVPNVLLPLCGVD